MYSLVCQVFRILLKWADDLKSGLVGSEDVVYLKESLLKLEYTVIPTIQDKWVSLHPKFGLVCWCDDDELSEQFKYTDNIDFVYFGELSNYEKEMLPAKLAPLMQTIGIPALSEVIFLFMQTGKLWQPFLNSHVRVMHLQCWQVAVAVVTFSKSSMSKSSRVVPLWMVKMFRPMVQKKCIG